MPRWLKWLLTIIIFVGLTVGLYFVGFKGEWIKPIVESTGIWGYFIYIILQVIITTLMCFVPATTFTFTLISVQIFGVVTGLILSIIACWLSSITMFLVGRYGGVKLVDWLIGKSAREKAQEMISDRAIVLLPVMLACPFFPDDALCLVAGMTKINIWYFIIMSLLTRSLGITVTALLGNDATINYIKATLGNNIVLWVIAINIVLVDIYAIWKLSGKLENILKKRRLKKSSQENENHEEIISETNYINDSEEIIVKKDKVKMPKNQNNTHKD